MRAKTEIQEIPNSEAGPEILTASDAFIVVDELAAAIDDRSFPKDLDWFGMVRRMPMNDVDTAIDKGLSELALAVRDCRPPGVTILGKAGQRAVPLFGQLDLGERRCDELLVESWSNRVC